MGLFSTLQATATAGNASSNNNSNHASSLSVPTLIQLSTDHYQIALPPQVTSNNTTNNTTDNNNSRNKKQQNLTIAHMPSWAALTYQTCIVDTSGMELGVWNCPLLAQDFFMPPKLNTNNNMARKFVMTIDLRTTASLVEPHITRIQQALVRYWIQQEPVETFSTSTTSKEQPDSTTDENTHATLATANNDDEDMITTTTTNETTSLQQLKTVQFGIANQDNDNTSSTFSTTTLEEHDATTKMALLICAMVDSPPKNKNDTTKEDNDNDDKNTSLDDDDDDDEESSYTRQQTQALLQYHLRKYAHALNCALVYVTEDDTTTTTTTTTTTNASGIVTVSQLAILWRAFALGQPIWKTAAQLLEVEEAPEQPLDNQDDTTPDTSASASSSSSIIVHGPDAYQEDLLDSVLLRNAQYPGKWDAAKESLWKILPYEDSETMLVNNNTTTATTKHKNDTAGDQSWLTELSQSMEVVDTTTSSSNKDASASASMKSPAAAKTPGKKTTKKTAEPATPGDAAAFFESLLK